MRDIKNALITIFLTMLLPLAANAATPSDFARKLCRDEPATYMCMTVKIPKTAKQPYKEWSEMFPDVTMRRIVMAINRRNTLLWNGHTVAVPRNYVPDQLAYAPLPRRKVVVGSSTRFVVVDLKVLAWAAYLATPSGDATLVRWGPANGGSKVCKESGKPECKTHPGLHVVLKLHKANKRSDLYPVDCVDKRTCGHHMPHYMPFHKDGTGLHGDKWLVGRNASHGCVRMLKGDAKWLNREFAFVGMLVLVEDY